MFPFLRATAAAPALGVIERALGGPNPPTTAVVSNLAQFEIARAIVDHFPDYEIRYLMPALSLQSGEVSSAHAGTRLWNALNKAQRRPPTWEFALSMSISSMWNLRGIGETSTTDFLLACIRISLGIANSGRMPLYAPVDFNQPPRAPRHPEGAEATTVDVPPPSTDSVHAGPVASSDGDRLTAVLPFLREPVAALALRRIEESLGASDPPARAIKDFDSVTIESWRAIVDLFPNRPLKSLFPWLGERGADLPMQEAGTRLWNAFFRELRRPPTWAYALSRSANGLMGLRGIGELSITEFLRACIRVSLEHAQGISKPGRASPAQLSSPTEVIITGKMVRDYRRDRGLSHSRLGELVGASQALVSQWETGQQEVSSPHAERLYELLRESPHEERVRALIVAGLLKDEEPSATPGVQRSEWFAETRERRGLTITRISEGTGISEQRLVDWEFGLGHPSDREWHLIRAFMTAQADATAPSHVESAAATSGETDADLEEVSGSWLTKQRTKLGWKKEQVANAIKCHTAFVDLWELEIAEIPAEFHAPLRALFRDPFAAVVGRAPAPRAAKPPAPRVDPAQTTAPSGVRAVSLGEHQKARTAVRKAHVALSTSFAALASARPNGVVYAREHGLEGDALAETISAAQAWLGRANITPGEWRDCYLPLLVAAAEAACGYDGPGTEYWSLLEERVGFQFDLEARQRVRIFFELAAQEHHFAKPSSTPWADQFQLISWPITHAVLSRDIHRALGRALALLEIPIAPDTPPGAVVEALSRNAERLGGRRFQHLVNDTALITGLVKEILGIEGASGLEPKLMRRLLADLGADAETSADLDRAKARQRRERADVVNVSLALDPDRHPPQLLVQFPLPPEALQDRVREAMARGRYAPALWGMASSVRLDRLLSGAPVRLTITAWPSSTTPLFPDLGAAALDEDLKRYLGGLFANVSGTSTIFARAGGEGIAVQVASGAVAADDELWALMDPQQVPEGLSAEESLAGRVVVALGRPDSAAAQALLGTKGVTARGRWRTEVVGSPPIDSTRGAAFFLGDVVALHVQETPPGGALVLPDGARRDVPAGVLLAVTSAGPGATYVRLHAESASETQPFFFAPAYAPSPVAWSSLEGELGLGALRRRELALKVSATRRLEDLPVTATLVAAGRPFAYTTTTLPAAPAVLGAADRFWTPLVSAAVAAQARGVRALELRVSIAHLNVKTWPLEDEQREVVWREGELSAVGRDGRPVQLDALDERAPAGPTLVPSATPGDVVVVAFPRDRQTDPIDGLCAGPESISWEYRAPPAPRLRRSVADGPNGSLGLEALARAYVAWTTAACPAWNVELRRRDVVRWLDDSLVALACGDAWARLERPLRDTAAPSSSTALVQACLHAEDTIGFDDLTELTPEERALFTPRLTQVLATEVDDLEEIVRAAAATDVGPLNAAFEQVYHELARTASDPARADELSTVEIAYRPEHWSGALADARARLCLEPLAPLLWPTDARAAFIERDYRTASVGELAEALTEWSADHSAAHVSLAWSREEVEALLAFWVDPRAKQARGWPLALERLIADRAVTRAVRYVALRLRAARGDGGVGA